MARPLTDAAVKKKLGEVHDKLANAKLTSEKRLALLRQQADLGDRRDAAVDAARRSQSSR